MGPTYQLFAGALQIQVLVFLHVSGLTRLGRMKPSADTQPLVLLRTLLYHDLFHRMMAPPRLYFEKDELVPTGRY